jgi:hypothetical protein
MYLEVSDIKVPESMCGARAELPIATIALCKVLRVAQNRVSPIVTRLLRNMQPTIVIGGMGVCTGISSTSTSCPCVAPKW